MNHYKARQQTDTGKWHYTCYNDREKFAYPVGPCAEKCEGHDTLDQACEHYKQGLVENAHFVGPKKEEWPKNKCQFKECNNESTYYAHVASHTYYTLCEQHANKESLNELVTVGESWGS